MSDLKCELKEDREIYGGKDGALYPGRKFEFELKPERVSATILDKVSVLVTVDEKEMILSIRDFLILYDIRRR